MTRDSVHQLLRAIGVRDAVDAENFVNCTCPFARWRHSKRVDTRPSFGVSVNPEGFSVYYCFGCMEKPRRIESILSAWFVVTGVYPWAAARVILASGALTLDVDLAPIGPWEKEHAERRETPIPRFVFEKYPLLATSPSFAAIEAVRWMEKDIEEKGRGIPVWVQNQFRLRLDEGRHALVFPLADHTGRIYLMRERRINTKDIWTVTPELAGVYDLEFARLKDVGVWFGMRRIDWSRPVMVVEGEFDAMRIAALGFQNVIASTTSSVTDAQIDALKSDTIILGYDPDQAGQKAHKRIRERVGGKAIVLTADWTVVDRHDGGDLRSREELKEVLDGMT